MERNECDAKGALRDSGTLKENRILKVGSKRGFVSLKVFSLKNVHKGAFATPFRMLSLKETKRDNVVI